MRRTVALLRGAKGYGWYSKYVESGVAGFKKNVSPTPFNWEEPIDGKRPKVYFDMTLGEENIGRMVVELASDVVPRTCENFKLLCEKETKGLKNTKLFHIQKGSYIAGGDVESNDGSKSHSAYEDRFIKDENFIIPHSSAGLVSMVSVGRNTIGSQFCITLNEAPYLDGRYTVFGRVVEGSNLLEKMQKVFTFRGAPSVEIGIQACGVLKE